MGVSGWSSGRTLRQLVRKERERIDCLARSGVEQSILSRPFDPCMHTLSAVFAHPDDETFSIAGTVASLVRRGVDCALFCATDGDAGRASGMVVGSREELGRVRRRELQEAARAIGFATVVTPGYADGALGAADQDALVGDVVRFLRERRPDVVVTFGPEGAPNLHRDHRAISRAAT